MKLAQIIHDSISLAIIAIWTTAVLYITASHFDSTEFKAVLGIIAGITTGRVVHRFNERSSSK